MARIPRMRRSPRAAPHEERDAASGSPDATIEMAHAGGQAAPAGTAGGAGGEDPQSAGGSPDARPDAGVSFLDRGRGRRRLRYLRRARELAYRDLGGLVFDLQRFGRSRDDLLAGKIERLTAIDTELRALERALDDRQDVTVIREPGLSACPRCGALHGSDANYCSSCALPVNAAAGVPIGATPAAPGSTSQHLPPPDPPAAATQDPPAPAGAP